MKVGVFQAAGEVSPRGRLDVLEQKLIADNLDIVVCPELFMTGYHIGKNHRDLAEERSGSFAHAVAALARQTGTAVVYGYPERDGDRIYNSAQLIGPDGDSLSNHRKQLPAPDSFEEATFVDGPSPTFVNYRDVKLAIAICYEIEFPETVRHAALRGAQLLLAPTALAEEWSRIPERVIPARAFENGVWIAYANYAGLAIAASGEKKIFAGGSRIVAPDGRDHAVAKSADELIVADIDPRQVDAMHRRLPYLRDIPRLTKGFV